jgi:hypothetical protein
MPNRLKKRICGRFEVHFVCTGVDLGPLDVYRDAYNSKATPVNRLSLTRRTQVINCLVEGNSIRSTERMTDTHRDTIMRLMVEVGQGCAALANEQIRDLSCEAYPGR